MSEKAFRARLSDLGATLLEEEWLGYRAPHRAICRAGHECSPRPSGLQRGEGACLTCAGRDPHVAEAKFRARVEELGGVVLEPRWRGSKTLHLVRCVEGHEVRTHPSGVLRGGGICCKCKNRIFDVFYVVANEIDDLIKFGITSGNPRSRLRRHETDGFDRVVRLCQNLPDTVAPDLERTILAALKDAREKPVRGREYFPTRVLPVVLDLFDHHPEVRAARLTLDAAGCGPGRR